MWLGLPEGQPSSGEEAAAYGDPAGKEREARASTPVSLLQGRRARACSPRRPAAPGLAWERWTVDLEGQRKPPPGASPPPSQWNSGGSTGAGGGSSEFSGPSRCAKLTLSPWRVLSGFFGDPCPTPVTKKPLQTPPTTSP